MSEGCKHGLTEETCHFCQGGKPSNYGQGLGPTWIRTLVIDWNEARDFAFSNKYED